MINVKWHNQTKFSKYSTKSFSKFSIKNTVCVPEPWVSSRLTTPHSFPIFFVDVSLLKISLKYFIPSFFLFILFFVLFCFVFVFFFTQSKNQSWVVVYLQNDPITGIELKGLFFPSNKPFGTFKGHRIGNGIFPTSKKKRL